MTENTHTHDESPDFIVACFHRVRSAIDGHCRCGECGSSCSMLNSVCETCGKQDPIRLPIAWAVFAIGLFAILLAIRVLIF